MCHIIQAQISVSNFINCNVPHHTGTNNYIETFKTVICYTIQAQIIALKFSVYKVGYNNVCLYGVAHYSL
jgi:hypothetical protein